MVGGTAPVRTMPPEGSSMKCPLCGKPVSEPGACRECLPYNLYTIDGLVQSVGYESLRRLMVAKLVKTFPSSRYLS